MKTFGKCLAAILLVPVLVLGVFDAIEFHQITSGRSVDADLKHGKANGVDMVTVSYIPLLQMLIALRPFVRGGNWPAK